MDKDTETAEIRKRSFVSTMSLFFQSGYSAILGLVANLILTILLSPKVFGIYITVLSLIAFLNYFSDVGLAASLIQKKEITDDDLTTTFTVQQGLTLILVIIGFFASSFIKSFYKLPQEGVYLYWALLVSFFFSSMKTIPSVFLERKIKFQKIVFVQIIENTVFYAAVSIFALMGFGLTSFTIAVCLRAFVGLILIYWISFWMPKIGISKESLKKLLSFGLPFQATSFLALFKDDLIILYLGKVLGFEGVGYIGWAKKWADAPIRIIMDNITKVIFPLIARFQDEKEKIRSLAEKILYYQTSLLAPVTIGMIVIIKNFVETIPNYSKWQPALPLFYIFAISSLLLSFAAPFMHLYNALGRVRVSFSFMLLFTCINWVATVTLTYLYGYYGFPLAHLIVSISFILVLLKAKKEYGFSFFKPVYKFVLSSLLMGGFLIGINLMFKINSLVIIGEMMLFGGIIYYLLITFLFDIDIHQEFKSFVTKKV